MRYKRRCIFKTMLTYTGGGEPLCTALCILSVLGDAHPHTDTLSDATLAFSWQSNGRGSFSTNQLTANVVQSNVRTLTGGTFKTFRLKHSLCKV